MSTNKASPRTAKAAREFTDAGTGKTFAEGETIEAEAGAIANYRAAGLVAGDTEEAAKPTE